MLALISLNFHSIANFLAISEVRLKVQYGLREITLHVDCVFFSPSTYNGHFHGNTVCKQPNEVVTYKNSLNNLE